MRLRTALAAAPLLALPVAHAAAQPRWKTVGHTADGNPVQVSPKSVKRAGSTVAATVRVEFLKPKKMPGGNVTSSRTMLTFDCAKRSVAIKENTYYFDEKADKVFQRSVAQIPGYSPVMGGSMTQVAYDDLCKK